MQDIIASLISFFLLSPLQAEVRQRLDAAQVPPGVVSDITACGRAAAPAIAERALSDPWWAVSQVVRVWTGTTSPDRLLVEVAPGCASAVAAARPFLGEQSAS
jgi:hypothetical protein